MDLKILYEDNHLIAVLKEPGVLTQSGSLDLPDLLTETKLYLKEKYNKQGQVFLGMMHRLDTNVGGVLCFAKTSKAASRVSKEIRNQQFEKRYLAIVEGNIESEEKITLHNYLKKDNINKKSLVTNKNQGKESILKFKKIKTINNLTLVEIELITGRFHQIRSQLAHFGTPIYGDLKYGSKNRIKSIALFAYYISFKHPTKDENITIKTLPDNELFSLFLKDVKLV